ncbi:MAG: hypothetical protein ACFFCQ_09545 [Promethearchaeota archaeon]
MAVIIISKNSTAALLYTDTSISSSGNLSNFQENIPEIDVSNLPYLPFLDNLFFFNTFPYDSFSLETISAFIDYDRDVLLQYDGIDVNRGLIDIQNFNWDSNVLQNTTIAFFGSVGHLNVRDLPDYFPYFFPIIPNLNNSGLLIVSSPTPLDDFKQDISQIELVLDPLNLSLSFLHCSWTELEKQTVSFAVWQAHTSRVLLDSVSANKGLANLLNSSQISVTQKNDLSLAFLRSSFTNKHNNSYSFGVRVQYELPKAAEDNKFYSSNFIDPISPNLDHNISLGIVVAPPSPETDLPDPLYNLDKFSPMVDFRVTVDPWFNGETVQLINPLILPFNRTGLEESDPWGIFDGSQFMEIAVYNIHLFSSEIDDYVDMRFSNSTDITNLGLTIENAPKISPLISNPTAELQLEIQSVPRVKTNQTIQVIISATNQGSKAALMPVFDPSYPHEYGIFVSFSGFPYDLIIDDYITLDKISYPKSGDFLVLTSCLEKEMLLYANSYSSLQGTLEAQPIYPNQSQSWSFWVKSGLPGELEIRSAYAGYLSVEKDPDGANWIPTSFPASQLNDSAFFELKEFINYIPIPFPLLYEQIPTYFCISVSSSLEIMVETESTTSFVPQPFFVGSELFWECIVIISTLFFAYSIRKGRQRNFLADYL